MISGIKNHLDISIRYDQTRGAWENFLRDIMIEFIKDKKITYEEAVWLFTCGMSAFSTEMEGLGYLQPSMYFQFPGKSKRKLQMDDAHMCTAMDPQYDLFKDKPDNYFLDTYIELAKDLYDCPAYRVNNPTFVRAASELKHGNGIQICLKIPPHWIAPVDYDDVKNIIRYHDSFAGRDGLINNGIHEPLYFKDWDNIVPAIAVYPRKKDEIKT